MTHLRRSYRLAVWGPASTELFPQSLGRMRRVIPLSVIEKVCLPNTLVLLFQCRDIPTLITWAFFLCLISISLPQPAVDVINSLLGTRASSAPPAYVVFAFIFFRVAYNVGLGFLLRQQSRTEFVTRFVERLKREGGPSWQYRLVRKSLRDVRCTPPLPYYSL